MSLFSCFLSCYGQDIHHDVQRPTINPDGSINWEKWYELLKESKLPYMTYDPPQKKVEFAGKCRNCYLFQPRACLGRYPPCCVAACCQYKYGPYSSLQVSKGDEWLGKMLEVDRPHCPDFLRGVWWMRDNVANETLVTFQDSVWEPNGKIGLKDSGTNWSTGSSAWGSILAGVKRFVIQWEIEPLESPKWMCLRNGDDWIYILGEEDKGKLVYPDGKPVEFVPGLDMLRVSVSDGDPFRGVFYQYLVRKVAFKDSDGKIVKTQYYDEIVERCTRPTPDGCCCNLFLCNVSDEDYPAVYDALDDNQIIIYNQDKYPPAAAQ